MKLKIILFACVFALIFSSCEDNKPATNTLNSNSNHKQSEIQNNQNSKDSSASLSINLNEPNYEAVPRSKKDNLNPDLISKFIPLKIKGIKQGAFVKYQSDEGNGIITSCASTYDLDKMSTITITIIDNGPTATIIDKKYYDVLPVETGFVSTRIALPNGRGYSMWNKLSKNGQVSVLYNNRVIVTIDGRNVKESFLPLESHLKLIDIDKILKNL